MAGCRYEDDAPVTKEVVTLAETEIGPTAQFIDSVVLRTDLAGQRSQRSPALDELQLLLVDPHGNAAQIFEAADVIPVCVRQDYTLQAVGRNAGACQLLGDRAFFLHPSRLPHEPGHRAQVCLRIPSEPRIEEHKAAGM